MSKNLLFSAIGVALGFVIGFIIANAVSRPSTVPAAGQVTSAGAAGPLDPSLQNGPLPPDHPDVGGAGAAPGAAAANSAEAQAAMEKADRGPRDFDAQVAAARVFYRLDDFDKAALYLDRALALKPKDYEALVAMGNTKYDGGDFEAAATFYERALAIRPDVPDVRADYGNTYFRRTPPDYGRAITEYRKAVAVDPRHETAWKNIAAAALNLKDRAQAAEAVGRLAAINPQSPELESLRRSLEALQ